MRGRRMGKVSRLALWVNLIVISGTWGSSFAFVKLITGSMYPFAFAAVLVMQHAAVPLMVAVSARERRAGVRS
jgi:hypothetical protein